MDWHSVPSHARGHEFLEGYRADGREDAFREHPPAGVAGRLLGIGYGF